MLLPLALAACATGTNDCAEAIAAAAAAGQQAAWLDPVLATTTAPCRAPATAAWLDAASALDCAPRHAFVAARLGAEVDQNCSSDAYLRAERLGRMIGELERERSAIERELARDDLAAPTRRDLRRRQIVIERDLPQLIALAQFDDLEPPASVPDRPRS